jgi:polyhydroxybutyrate depolymerase
MKHACILVAVAALAVTGCGGSSNKTGDGEEEATVDPAPDEADTDGDGQGDNTGEADGRPDTDGDADDLPDVEPTEQLDGPSDVEPEDAPPPPCPVPDDLGPGEHTVAIDFDGMGRQFILHVPAVYDPSTPTPLIVNMHGFMSAAWQQVLFSAMNPAADAHGFIVLYPDGYMSSWNAGTCCGTAATMGLDDVGFIKAAVADASTKLCVDPRRVYATGMSNGGYMSHRLGCEASDVFAAVAPVAGAMGIEGCDPPRPVPMIAFHGTEDPLVSYEDGNDAFLQWSTVDHCTGDPVRTYVGDSWCDVHESCADGVKVALCTLDPMGHCWPGGSEALCLSYLGAYNDDISANERMWEFFQEFTLP